MVDIQRYLDLAPSKEVRFNKDHNDIVDKRSGILGFIGRLWDRITGSSSLHNIFHAMVEDIHVAPVNSYDDAENIMQLKDRVQARKNEFCKASWVTRHFGAHGDVEAPAGELARLAVTKLNAYWTGLEETGNSRLVEDVYGELHNSSPGEAECNELDRKVATLLGTDDIDALQEFYTTKCGNSPIIQYHIARLAEHSNPPLAFEAYTRAAGGRIVPAMEKMDSIYREGGLGQAPDLKYAHEYTSRLAANSPQYALRKVKDHLYGAGTQVNLSKAKALAVALIENPAASSEIKSEAHRIKRTVEILQQDPTQTTRADLDELEYYMEKLLPDTHERSEVLEKLIDGNLAAPMYLVAKSGEYLQDYYKMAADLNLPAAQYSCAQLHLDRQEYSDALIFAEKAADNGDDLAQLLVAQMDLKLGREMLGRSPAPDLAEQILFSLFGSHKTPGNIRLAAAEELVGLHEEKFESEEIQDDIFVLGGLQLNEEQIILYKMGLLYEGQNDITKAQAAYKSSGAAQAFMDLAMRSKGYPEVASEYLTKAANMGVAKANLELATIDEEQGAFDRARVLYLRAVTQGVKEAWYPSIRMLLQGIDEGDVAKAQEMMSDPSRPNDPRIEYAHAMWEMQKQRPNWKVVKELLVKSADGDHLAAKATLLSLVRSEKIKSKDLPLLHDYEASLDRASNLLGQDLKLSAKKMDEGKYSSGEMVDRLKVMAHVSAHRNLHGNVLISDATRKAIEERGGDFSQEDAENLALLAIIIDQLKPEIYQQQGLRAAASIVFKTETPTEQQLERLPQIFFQVEPNVEVLKNSFYAESEYSESEYSDLERSESSSEDDLRFSSSSSNIRWSSDSLGDFGSPFYPDEENDLFEGDKPEFNWDEEINFSQPNIPAFQVAQANSDPDPSDSDSSDSDLGSSESSSDDELRFSSSSSIGRDDESLDDLESPYEGASFSEPNIPVFEAAETKNEIAIDERITSPPEAKKDERMIASFEGIASVDYEEQLEGSNTFIDAQKASSASADLMQSTFEPAKVETLADEQLSAEAARDVEQSIGADGLTLTLMNYSRNKLVGTMSQVGVQKSEWTFIAEDNQVLTLTTRALPEDVMEYYTISVNDRDILVDENPAATRVQCAKMIDASLPEFRSNITREYYIETILNSLWRTGGLAKANEEAKRRLGEDLDTGQIGPVSVNVNADENQIKVTHSLRRQLQTVNANGERINQPYFSTWTIATTINNQGAENVEISFSPWISPPPPAEPEVLASQGDAWVVLEVPPEVVSEPVLDNKKIGIFDYNDNALKQEKYEKSMESTKKALDRVPDTANLRDRLEVPEGGDVRSYYRWFLDGLRGFLTSKAYTNNKQGHPILEVVKARFQGNRMYEYCETLVSSAMGRGPIDAANLSFEEQFEAIDNLPAELAANRLAVNLGKLQGTLNIGFDPHRATNTPYANYSFELGGKERTNLRFGTPTWEGFWYSASVIPEFTAFLDALKQEGKKHLYINLQNRNPKTVGDESGRCKALEKLGGEYPDTFFIATFAQDTKFYKQSEQYKEMDSARDFLAAFEDQMFNDPKSGFFFSDNLKQGDNQQKLKNALRDVHREIFGDRDTLSLAERQAFIEISYSLMTLRLLEMSDADTYNMSCKDAIDRGGKCSSLLFYTAGLLNDLIGEEEFKLEHMTVTHAPALIVKKQAIIHSRRDRLVQALNILKQVNPEGLKALYQVGQPEVCRRDPPLEKVLGKIVDKAAKSPSNLQTAFADQEVRFDENQKLYVRVLDDRTAAFVRGDPLGFYEYELAKSSSDDLFAPIGFENYGPFLHQDKIDIQDRKKNFVNIPNTPQGSQDRLETIFNHLLDKVGQMKEGQQALQDNPEIVYKAIHAAISGCTQSFEAPTFERLINQQAILGDRNLNIMSPSAPYDITFTVSNGAIHVTSEGKYRVMSTDDLEDKAYINATRAFSVPINSPQDAQRLPDRFEVVA